MSLASHRIVVEAHSISAHPESTDFSGKLVPANADNQGSAI
jgi:hypothetical protein